MIKREKKRKLCGSVLLTVVCVMSLLIIFLFGTLALATAANNRAHVNYSTAQTEVTSRTVVDAAIKAMEANKDFGNAVSALKADNPLVAPLNVFVDFSGVPDAGKYGHIANNKMKVDIVPVGKKKFYDENKKEWIEGDIIQFTSTVSMAGVDSTTKAYIVKAPPDYEEENKKTAGLVTTEGSADFACQTSVYGGTYINLPKLEDAEKFDYRYSYIKNSVEKASEERDYSDWGKNAEGKYIDEQLYRHFAPADDASATSFKLSDNFADSTIEAGVYVVNNMEFNKGTMLFPEAGEGLTIWGDLKIGSNAKDSPGWKYVNNVSATEIKFNEIPYIYVDGKVYGDNIILGNAGDSNEPLNIFCGSIDADFSSAAEKNIKIGGDLYLMNPYKKSTLKTQNSTRLYNWTGSVIYHTSDIAESHNANSIYSKGDLELENITIDGDVRVEGTCTIGKDVTIKGDLVAKKLLQGNEAPTVWGKIYCGNLADVLKEKDVLAGYRKVPIIEHNEEKVLNDGITAVFQNEKRYYCKVKCLWTQQTGGSTDPFGMPTKDGQWEIYFKFNNDFQPSMYEGDYTFIGGENYDEMKQNFDKISPYLDLSAGYMLSNERPSNSVDGSVDYYYVETDYNEDGTTSAESVEVDYAEYGLREDGSKETDPNNIYKIIPAHKTIPNYDGTDSGIVVGSAEDIRADKDKDAYVYYNSSGEIVTEKEAVEAKKKLLTQVKNITDYTQDIYPKYAEREVILGLKDIEGHEVKNGKHTDGTDNTGCTAVSETQIVSTIEEVLNSVNPHQYGIMAEPFKDAMDNAVKYGSVKEILEDTKQYTNDASLKVNGDYTAATLDPSEFDGSGKLTGNYTGSSAKPLNNGGPIINKSCVLNIASVSNGECRAIVIDPNGAEIYIVIEELGIDSSIDIIINDSKPGSVVNFYINGKLNLDGSNIITTGYLKALNENAGGFIGYNSSGCDLNLEDLGSPRVNIYGGAGSELNSSNTRVITANIRSPYLKANFSGTAGSDRNVKYDNSVIPPAQCKQLVIGCLNVMQTTMPNVMSVIYIPPTKGTGVGGTAGTGTNEFNYRVSYYDEY